MSEPEHFQEGLIGVGTGIKICFGNLGSYSMEDNAGVKENIGEKAISDFTNNEFKKFRL